MSADTNGDRVRRYVAVITTLVVIFIGCAVGKRWAQRPVSTTVAYGRPLEMTICDTPTVAADIRPTELVNNTWLDLNLLCHASPDAVAHRQHLHIDEFVLASARALQQDPELCAVSAVEYGLSYRATALRSSDVAVNAWYVQCRDDQRTTRLQEESGRCAPDATPEYNRTSAVRYECIEAMYLELRTRRHVHKRLMSYDAYCFQHHVDQQNAAALPCPDANDMVMRVLCVPIDVVDVAARLRSRELAQLRATANVEL